jgi:hypothetical protein
MTAEQLAEQLLTSLERRGFKTQLHPKGGISIVPTFGLTADDRSTLKQVAVELERLLRERESHPQRLSAADARMIDRAREAYEVKQPVEVCQPEARRSHNWPPVLDSLPSGDQPVAESIANKREEKPVRPSSEQLPMFVPPTRRKCPTCGLHSFDATQTRCKNCGAILPPARVPLVAHPPNAATAELPEHIEQEALMEPEHVQHPPSATVETETKVSQLDTVIAHPPEQAAVPATNQSISDKPPESEGEVKAAAPLRSPGTSSGPAAAVASDLPAFRDHIRSRRAALAGFMEQGALLAFENGTLTVSPRNDIYVRYLADNRQVIGELAMEFFGCTMKIELAGAAPHPAVVDKK